MLYGSLDHIPHSHKSRIELQTHIIYYIHIHTPVVVNLIAHVQFAKFASTMLPYFNLQVLRKHHTLDLVFLCWSRGVVNSLITDRNIYSYVVLWHNLEKNFILIALVELHQQ